MWDEPFDPPEIDPREWYMERLRSFGWMVKAMTFVNRRDESDSVVCVGHDANSVAEIVNSHNAQPLVVKTKQRVLDRVAGKANG